MSEQTVENRFRKSAKAGEMPSMLAINSTERQISQQNSARSQDFRQSNMGVNPAFSESTPGTPPLDHGSPAVGRRRRGRPAGADMRKQPAGVSHLVPTVANVPTRVRGHLSEESGMSVADGAGTCDKSRLSPANGDGAEPPGMCTNTRPRNSACIRPTGGHHSDNVGDTGLKEPGYRNTTHGVPPKKTVTDATPTARFAWTASNIQ
jgi:hypothetical protein